MDRVPELSVALKSVYQQSTLPKEVIVVDDASRIPISLEQLPSPPEGIRLHIVRNDENVGAALSRNIGVQASSGDVVAFLDSDDAFTPRYIDRLVDAWSTASSKTACIATGFYWCDNDLHPYRSQQAPENVTREDLVRRGNVVGGCSVLSVRRESFIRAGGFIATRGAQDWGLLLRMSLFAPIHVVQELLVLYRAPATSKLSNMTYRYRPQALGIAKIFRSLEEDERILARPLRTFLLAEFLARGGKKRAALRILLLHVKYTGRVDFQTLRVLSKIVLGNFFYRFLMTASIFLRQHSILGRWS